MILRVACIQWVHHHSPFVVVVGWVTGHDFTLDFDPFATLALTVSVMHANFVTSDARSHWLMVSEVTEAVWNPQRQYHYLVGHVGRQCLE